MLCDSGGMSGDFMPEGQFALQGRMGEWANLRIIQVIQKIQSVDKINFVIAETMGFVDKLFECLTTKNYLGIPAAKETPKEEVKPPAVKSDVVEVRRASVKICWLSMTQKWQFNYCVGLWIKEFDKYLIVCWVLVS